MIPKISGEVVCKRIRAVSNVPIIMLNAKAEEDDKTNYKKTASRLNIACSF